jgi:hypothetical protein
VVEVRSVLRPVAVSHMSGSERIPHSRLVSIYRRNTAALSFLSHLHSHRMFKTWKAVCKETSRTMNARCEKRLSIRLVISAFGSRSFAFRGDFPQPCRIGMFEITVMYAVRAKTSGNCKKETMDFLETDVKGV